VFEIDGADKSAKTLVISSFYVLWMESHAKNLCSDQMSLKFREGESSLLFLSLHQGAV
jgi:hypothetical protein